MRDNTQHECIVHSHVSNIALFRGAYQHKELNKRADQQKNADARCKSSTNVWGDWMGVMHGDEIEYVFGHPLNTSVEYTERERDLANRMIMIYSNFARHGPVMTYLSVRIESSSRERDEILSICQPRKIRYELSCRVRHNAARVTATFTPCIADSSFHYYSGDTRAEHCWLLAAAHRHMTRLCVCICRTITTPTLKENEWPAYTRDQPNYYILNAENNGMGKGPRTTACTFWNDFMPRLKGAPGDLRAAHTTTSITSRRSMYHLICRSNTRGVQQPGGIERLVGQHEHIEQHDLEPGQERPEHAAAASASVPASRQLEQRSSRLSVCIESRAALYSHDNLSLDSVRTEPPEDAASKYDKKCFTYLIIAQCRVKKNKSDEVEECVMQSSGIVSRIHLKWETKRIKCYEKL
ncbi:unnamed protein product [Trichogramma brassicae]|uniref:Carboxylesterase type B domain-containing protein n=1 Tax=Trichogramma brassicae TaxID=86971 RepID=A0A6H5I5H5_9HYME|nr:unnamed protein product [Trichogramma brassicae]